MVKRNNEKGKFTFSFAPQYENSRPVKQQIPGFLISVKEQRIKYFKILFRISQFIK